LLEVATVRLAACAQIAVLKETEGRGPYCSLVMAVVVTKDVLVFICFSLNIELSALVRAVVDAWSPALCLHSCMPVSVSVFWLHQKLLSDVDEKM